MTQKAKLLDHVRAVARAGHLSYRTENTYHNFIKRFIPFHNKLPPKRISVEEIFEFLSQLAGGRKNSCLIANESFFGRITMQRKGGDGGRDTAKMLQFKINPALLFDAK